MIDYNTFLQKRINDNPGKYSLDKNSPNYNEIVSLLKQMISTSDDVNNGFEITFNSSFDKYSKKIPTFAKTKKLI